MTIETITENEARSRGLDLDRATRATVRSVAGLARALAPIGRKAAKMGVAAPVVVLVERGALVRVTAPDGAEVAIRGDRVALLTPEPIRLGGWSLAVRLDHRALESGTLASPLTDREEDRALAAQSSRREPGCAHCAANRRRNVTFLLRSVGGEVRQVGSTCLRDFTGIDPVLALATCEVAVRSAAALDEAMLDVPGNGGGTEYFAARDVLSLAARTIEAHGWRSRADAEAREVRSTSQMVREGLPWFLASRALGSPDVALSEAASAKVEAASEWLDQLVERLDLAGLEAPSADPYLSGLAACWAAGRVAAPAVGLLASVWRAMQTERARAWDAIPSVRVGEVKGKIEAHVEVTGVREVPSIYGVSTLYALRTVADAEAPGIPHGASLKYFSSRPLTKAGDEPLSLGDRVWLAASVKGHGEFRGVPETQITRGAVVLAPSARPAKRTRKTAKA